MKKGAYDLGRKAVYYIVVMIIIAILFSYMTYNFHKYQITRLSNLDSVTDLVMINNILNCISQKDIDTGKINTKIIEERKFESDALMDCLGREKPYTDKAIMLEIKEKKLETQEPFFEYNEYKKEVMYKGEKTELKISIEKYPKLT